MNNIIKQQPNNASMNATNVDILENKSNCIEFTKKMASPNEQQ